MKKILFFILIAILLAAGFFGWKFLFKPASKEEEKPAPKPKVENINQLALEQRPYIIVEPKSKTRPSDLGHWLTVTIDRTEAYERVEYDVEYQTGSLIQGFMHSIDFSKEPTPVSKEGFFGSESKGKYKYDEDVTTGNILFKFFKDSTSYDALKTYFNLQNMAEEDGLFISNDGKASLQVGVKDISSTTFVVIASTLGLPEEVEGQVLSEPYGFYAHKSFNLKNSTLTIKSKEELTKAKILGWDGKEWFEYETEIKADSASALVESLGTFVLVSND